MIYDAAIIGAGPAGLLCARNAARRGLRVALIDSHEEPGAKLAVAGGGKGNITNRILAENVGKPVEEVAKDTERDNWMFAEDALKYGIIDEIVKSKK